MPVQALSNVVGAQDNPGKLHLLPFLPNLALLPTTRAQMGAQERVLSASSLKWAELSKCIGGGRLRGPPPGGAAATDLASACRTCAEI